MKRRSITTCCMTFLICLSCIEVAPAEEPAERFLQALRENGYYDIALDYLESISDSPAVSDDFKKILPFEKAETLIKSTADIRNIDEWEKRLDEAQNLLAQSAKLADTPEFLSRAQRNQGNLLYRRARVYMKRADDERLTAGEQQQLMEQAQSLLIESRDVYQKARKSLASIISETPKDKDDPENAAKLKLMQSVFTKVRLQSPLIAEQLADTYPPGSEKQKKYLTEAAAGYADLWNKYFRFAAGLDSCLYAARCHYKLKDYDRCISYLQEIFSLNDSTALRTLKRKAMVLASDAWLQKKPYPYDDVIANFEPSVNRLSRSEIRNPEWQRVQIELSRAYRTKAEAMETGEGPKSTGKINNLNREAVKLAKSISRIPGPHREMASNLLEQWNLTVNLEAVEQKPIETFADANQKGTDYVGEIQIILGEVAAAKSAISAARNPTDKAAAQADWEEAKERLDLQAKLALEMFDKALSLANSETTRTEINKLRYFQSICHYAMSNYFEAALIGQFLLDRYPNVDGSDKAAGLAANCYAIIYGAASAEDKEFEKARLVKTCIEIVNRWPGSTQAGDAASVLTTMAIGTKDFANAEKYHGLIPENHGKHQQLAIKIGQIHWFHYIDQRKQKAADPSSITSEALATSLTSATSHLSNSLKSVAPSQVNYDLALGSLLLVDAYLEADDIESAVAQLESASVAPLDLVKEKHPAIMQSSNRDLFIRETFKIAVKTYLAALGKHPEDNQWVDKSRGILRQMREDAANSEDPQAQAKIVVIYSIIATQLKQQFDAIQEGQKRVAFANNLARFLESIENDSKDPKTILWAGATLIDVANSLSNETSESDAKTLYQQAVKSLNRAEALGLKDPKRKLELGRQRALAHQGLGEYEKSREEFIQLIKQTPNSLTFQLGVAELLQQQGVASNRSKPLAEAMMGTQKERDPKTKRQVNLIWGYRLLVKNLRDLPKYKDYYYRSLFGLIESRFEYGKLEKSEKAIDSALKELQNARKRDPELGGPKWKSRFEQLEQSIKQTK